MGEERERKRKVIKKESDKMVERGRRWERRERDGYNGRGGERERERERREREERERELMNKVYFTPVVERERERERERDERERERERHDGREGIESGVRRRERRERGTWREGG